MGTSTFQDSLFFSYNVVSIYKKYTENILPIYLDRHDFKYIFLTAQIPALYIKNTVYNNGIDMNGYWATFEAYNEFNELIDPSTYTFIPSSNSQPMPGTSIQIINNLSMQSAVSSNQAASIYNTSYAVTSSDNNPISLTLQLAALSKVQKVVIYHAPSNFQYQTNIVQISTDGINWTTIFDASVEGAYTEMPGGKTFCTFSPANIIFTADVENQIVPVSNIPILQSVCYVFDPDDNYQFYGILPYYSNGKSTILSKVYMWYQIGPTQWPNVSFYPISEFSIDFEHTDYDIDTNNTIYADTLRFNFSSAGQSVNEIQVFDVFNNNIILNLAPYEVSNNQVIDQVNNAYFMTDGNYSNNTIYTLFHNSSDGNSQYVIYKLPKKYKINNIRIFFNFQNSFNPTFQTVYDFSCQYLNDNNQWVTVYDTNKDGAFTSTYAGKDLLLSNHVRYHPVTPLNVRYIRYWLTNLTSASYIQPLLIDNDLFLPTPQNQNDYSYLLSPNLYFTNSDGVSVSQSTQLTDYYNQYTINNSSPSAQSYISIELPYAMNLNGIFFTTQPTYIQKIETSYNTQQYDSVYDSSRNGNLPSFISTYSVKNYQNPQEYGLLYTNVLPKDNVILNSKTSYMSFNNFRLFENQNKIMLFKGTLFDNTYNLNTIRYLLQTQSLNITYYTYILSGQIPQIHYVFGVQYIDLNNNLHNYNYDYIPEHSIQEYKFYLPFYFEFDIGNDNTFNYFIGTIQSSYNLDIPRIVSIGTVTNQAQIDPEAYLIIGNNTNNRTDNIVSQSEIYISYLHLLNLSNIQ